MGPVDERGVVEAVRLTPSPLPPPGAVAVIGCGLIGASVGLAVRRRWRGVRLVGVDHAVRLGEPAIAATFDVTSTELAAVGEADIVVLAAPVPQVLDLIAALPTHLAAGALVTDVGSTKESVMKAAAEAAMPHFVGGHPMAGGTTTGPTAARADLFDGHPWFLVSSDRASEARAAAFVAALGGVPLRTDAREHDRVMAAVSHLPQVVASVLMTAAGRAVGESGLAWAGSGLRDTTRLAASEASVWTGIVRENAGHLAPLLRGLAAELTATADALDDAAAVGRRFDEAVRWRRVLDRTLAS